MWGLNRGTLVDRYRATEHPTPRPRIKGPGSPGPKDHTYSPWFKSTLLLFLRLLLSTKKRWPAKPFFFFFFQEKQATENGILQIYRRGENGQNTLQMAWLCEEPRCAPPDAGSVFPSRSHVCFSASLSARGPL